jgi:hypothetical protein
VAFNGSPKFPETIEKRVECNRRYGFGRIPIETGASETELAHPHDRIEDFTIQSGQQARFDRVPPGLGAVSFEGGIVGPLDHMIVHFRTLPENRNHGVLYVLKDVDVVGF